MNEMPEDELSDEELPLDPPVAERVAARALVMAATSCRAAIESDALKPGAENFRAQILPWLERVGVAEEMEADEVTLLSQPLGKLDLKTVSDELWRSEGMVVLSWALGLARMPQVYEQCDSRVVANGLGLLSDRAKTVLNNPRLRSISEIEVWADTYMTLHWRLREFRRDPIPIDFVDYVATNSWGPLTLSELEIMDYDLAIDGVPIDGLSEEQIENVLSITQERHQALNWLLGFELIYSQVPTDT